MNGLLFDMPGEPKRRVRSDPLSHRHDPQTSRDAAEDLKASGRLGRHQQIVLDGVRRRNGGTHAEIAAITPLDWLQVARRLSELRRAGRVRRGAPRLCTVKRSRCCTWWVVTEDSE